MDKFYASVHDEEELQLSCATSSTGKMWCPKLQETTMDVVSDFVDLVTHCHVLDIAMKHL